MCLVLLPYPLSPCVLIVSSKTEWCPCVLWMSLLCPSSVHTKCQSQMPKSSSFTQKIGEMCKIYFENIVITTGQKGGKKVLCFYFVL